MKTIITTLLVSTMLFSSSCKEEKQEGVQAIIGTSEIATDENKPVNNSKNETLKQQGSYAQLFNREPKDCGFITAEMVAASIQVSQEIIEPGDTKCTYHLIEPNGKKTRLYFTVESWGNKRILKEINNAKDNAETFGKDSKLSQYRISETGDTYLSMHQNRMIRILNEVNETAITLFYFPRIEPDEKDLEKITMLKDEARERGFAIANFLLNKYQTK